MSITNTLRLIVAFFSTAVLSGCISSPTVLYHAQSVDKDIEIYATTAGVRGILLRKKSSVSLYCAEPQPDASVSESLSENVSASQAATGNESEGASETANENSLGGRSVNVLITREIFYRTSEFLVNTQLDDDAKLHVFKTSLESIISLNSGNLGVGTSNT